MPDSQLAPLATVLAPIGTGIIGYAIARWNLGTSKAAEAARLIRQYKFPLLMSALDLEERLEMVSRIAGDLDWLDAQYLDRIRDGHGFYLDPSERGYFLLSTLYLWARFFSWREIISREVGYVFQPRTRAWKEYASTMDKISRVFEYREIFVHVDHDLSDAFVKDCWLLHREMQKSLGEVIIRGEAGGLYPASFREFLELYVNDERFRYWTKALESYFIDLQKGIDGDARYYRCIAQRYWLAVLCRNLSETLFLDVECDPNEALTGIPEPIAQGIVGVTPTRLRAYTWY